MRAPGENPSTFQESIELNKPMTPKEATEKLAAFHGSTNEAVLDAFMNLRGFEDGTVTFEERTHNGWIIVYMTGRYNNGDFAWSHLIHPHTGNPLPRTG